MSWQAMKEEHLETIRGFQEQLDFMNEGNGRIYRREGNGPEIDITEQIKTDYQTNIDSHKRLIEIIDQEIASGR